jgi:hypothetical protein
LIVSAAAILCIIFGAVGCLYHVVGLAQMFLKPQRYNTSNRLWLSFFLIKSAAEITGGWKRIRRRPAGSALLCGWAVAEILYQSYLVGGDVSRIGGSSIYLQWLALLLSCLQNGTHTFAFPVIVLILFWRDAIAYLDTSASPKTVEDL